jgi:hypothetical protein
MRLDGLYPQVGKARWDIPLSHSKDISFSLYTIRILTCVACNRFWANVFYSPILLELYRTHLFPDSPYYIRILLFPMNVWVLEIIEGYVIIFIFGRNVAWEYKGWDSYFHGNIKLQYVVNWLGMGVAVELFYDQILVPFAILVSPYRIHFLIIASVLTLIFSGDMGSSNLASAWKGLTEQEKLPLRTLFMTLVTYYYSSNVNKLQLGLAMLASPIFSGIETTFTTLRHEIKGAHETKVVYGWIGKCPASF